LSRPAVDISPAGQAIFSRFFEQMRPKPRLTVSEHADKFRYVPSGPEPGKWRTSRVEYLREIMDAVTDPDVHVIVLESASQVAKSEFLLNTLFYFIDQDPCDMLMVQPTLTDARDFSRTRIAASIAVTPVIREIFGDDFGKSRNSSDTLFSKEYQGRRFSLVGSNSVSGLSSKPIRVVLCDEIGRFEPTKEGDAIELAMTRMTNFYNWLLILTSSPGTKGICRIDEWYEKSDKRVPYVPCEDCGKEILLEWKNVVWDKDDEGNHLPETARYACQECGILLNDAEINRMVAKGRWKATAPFKGIAGFGKLNAIYSPWKKLSALVEDFIRMKDDNETLKVFVNTRLGEAWEEEKEELDTDAIFERRESYDLLIPFDAAVLTAGIDIQDDRIEVLVEAWGKDERNWSIEHVVLVGDPSIPYRDLEQGQIFENTPPGVWNKLDIFLQKKYDHESGEQLKIACTAIDTGYKTDEVYAFVKPREHRGICAIKGGNKRGQPIIPIKPTRKNKGGVNLYNIGVFEAKNVVMSRLRIRNPERPGYMHFPDRFSIEFFQQLTAEKKVKKKKRGVTVPEWVKIRARNEAFDLKVYNLAALRIAFPERSLLNREVDRLHLRCRDGENKVNVKRSRRRVISKGVKV